MCGYSDRNRRIGELAFCDIGAPLARVDQNRDDQSVVQPMLDMVPFNDNLSVVVVAPFENLVDPFGGENIVKRCRQMQSSAISCLGIKNLVFTAEDVARLIQSLYFRPPLAPVAVLKSNSRMKLSNAPVVKRFPALRRNGRAPRLIPSSPDSAPPSASVQPVRSIPLKRGIGSPFRSRPAGGQGQTKVP